MTPAALSQPPEVLKHWRSALVSKDSPKDVRLVCRDGAVEWSALGLAHWSGLARSCLLPAAGSSGPAPGCCTAPATVMLPDFDRKTLRQALAWSLQGRLDLGRGDVRKVMELLLALGVTVAVSQQLITAPRGARDHTGKKSVGTPDRQVLGQGTSSKTPSHKEKKTPAKDSSMDGKKGNEVDLTLDSPEGPPQTDQGATIKREPGVAIDDHTEDPTDQGQLEPKPDSQQSGGGARDKVLKCLVCRKPMPSHMSRVSRHYTTHFHKDILASNGNKRKCTVCGYSAPRPYEVAKHVAAVHDWVAKSGPKKVRQQMANIKIVRRKTFDKHMTRDGGEEGGVDMALDSPEHSPQMIQRTLITKEPAVSITNLRSAADNGAGPKELEGHVKIFKCLVCSKSLPNKIRGACRHYTAHFNKDILAYNGDKGKCTVCGYCSPRAQDVIRHVAIVHDWLAMSGPQEIRQQLANIRNLKRKTFDKNMTTDRSEEEDEVDMAIDSPEHSLQVIQGDLIPNEPEVSINSPRSEADIGAGPDNPVGQGQLEQAGMNIPLSPNDTHDKTFKCLVCSKPLPSQISGVCRHYSVHFVKDILEYNGSEKECATCAYSSPWVKEVAKHVAAVHDWVATSGPTEVREQLAKMHKKNGGRQSDRYKARWQAYSVSCPLCPPGAPAVRMAWPNSLLVHAAEAHLRGRLEDGWGTEDGGSPGCKICGSKFPTGVRLARHVGVVHGKLREVLGEGQWRLLQEGGRQKSTEQAQEQQEEEPSKSPPYTVEEENDDDCCILGI